VEGIGFGFLIPVYFVTSGIKFDLSGLLAARRRCSVCRCSTPVPGGPRLPALLFRRSLGDR
jgi:hypothetical protein